VIALVNCLAKLHNFCIDVQEPDAPEESATDMLNMMTNALGYVGIRRERGVTLAPRGLANGGHHFDDLPREVRRRWTTESVINDVVLPRQRLLRQVIESHKVRPPVNCRQARKKKR